MHNSGGQSGWNLSGEERKPFSNYGRNNQQRRSSGGGGRGSHSQNRAANGNWPDAGSEGGQNGNAFNKFRDPQQELDNHQPNKRGGRRNRGGGGGGGGWGGRRGNRGRDSNRRGGRNNSWQPKDQHVSPGQSNMLYFDNVGDFTEDPPLPRSSPAPSSLRQESLPPVTFAADLTPPPPVSVAPPDVAVTPEEPTVPLINIKKEKEMEHKSKIKQFVKAEPKSPKKKKVNSSRSSSTSGEESEPEPGEMVVNTKAVVAPSPKAKAIKTPVASTPKPKAVKPVSSSDSSTSDSDTDDEQSHPPAKSKKMEKNTEEDVVCMGSQERQFTITDEEESTEPEDDKKARKQKNKGKTVDVCGICDKKVNILKECYPI